MQALIVLPYREQKLYVLTKRIAAQTGAAWSQFRRADAHFLHGRARLIWSR